MLEQGSNQFDIVMIVHIHVCGESFAETVRAYPVKSQIRAYCLQMLQYCSLGYGEQLRLGRNVMGISIITHKLI